MALIEMNFASGIGGGESLHYPLAFKSVPANTRPVITVDGLAKKAYVFSGDQYIMTNVNQTTGEVLDRTNVNWYRIDIRTGTVEQKTWGWTITENTFTYSQSYASSTGTTYFSVLYTT